MASPRSTPFIASWDAESPIDATVPLDEIAAAHPSSPEVARSPKAPAAGAPSRLEWSFVGVAGVVAACALLGAATSDRSHPPMTHRPIPQPPDPIRAELQAFSARIDIAPPDVTFAAAELDDPRTLSRSTPRPSRPARTVVRPRDELAAALLERRQQMSAQGYAGANVDGVAAINFDPTRRSARVVYHLADSADEVVEYWALRDGRWQAIED